MKYGYVNTTGGYSIASLSAFCDGLAHRDPLTLTSFEQILADCETLVRSEFNPSPQAINNVRGNWYEWLLSVGFISFFNQNIALRPRFFLPLPNVTGFDVYQLYKPEIYQFIADLRVKTEAKNVSLISSNPDYAILDFDDSLSLPSISQITPELVEFIDGLFRLFIGRCGFDQINGFASIKTSLRPDRRLQLAREGA
jgi:hypothetical protein